MTTWARAQGCADFNYPFLTQKERDNETGLDYFGARYYGSTQGRFTSPDLLVGTKKQVVNPQRWNLYGYVINNPLALYDPDGRQDEGKGGGKVIDVFIAIPPTQRGDRSNNGRGPAEKPPDWSQLQKNARDRDGVTVTVTMLDASTIGRVQQSREAGHDTVVIGHGIDITGSNPTRFTSDAAGLSDGYLRSGAVQSATRDSSGNYTATGEQVPLNQPAGGVVGLFTCNSEDVMPAGFSGQTVVTNDGGADGLTSLGTLERAGFAFVGTLADTNNPQAATNAGQRVMTNRSSMVVTEPNNPNVVIGSNKDDTLHIHRPQP